MSLKNDISNNRFPDVESTVKAIANRVFYKEIRIEQFDFEFTNNFFLSRILENKDYTLKHFYYLMNVLNLRLAFMLAVLNLFTLVITIF